MHWSQYMWDIKLINHTTKLSIHAWVTGTRVLKYACMYTVPISGWSWGSLCAYTYTRQLLHVHADPSVRVSAKSWYTQSIPGLSRGRYTYTSTHADPCVKVSVKSWYTLPIPGWSRDSLCRYTCTTLHADHCVRVSAKSWYTLPIPGWSKGRLCRYTYMSLHVNPSVREMVIYCVHLRYVHLHTGGPLC